MKRYYVLAFILLLLPILACGGSSSSGGNAQPTAATYVTLDGTENGELVVPEINVWKDYDNRGAGIVGVGKHGQQVKLIRRSGDGAKIELPNGAQGWVTYYFIKEYK
jgi:hypothetical protein